MAKSSHKGSLDADAPLKASLRKILRKLLDDTMRHRASLMDGVSVEAIHDTRVAARRLRALVRIFRATIPRKNLKKFNQELSALIRALGRVRDCDIIVDRLKTVRDKLPYEQQFALDDIIETQESARGRQVVVLKNELKTLRLRRFHRNFRQVIKDAYR